MIETLQNVRAFRAISEISGSIPQVFTQVTKVECVGERVYGEAEAVKAATHTENTREVSWPVTKRG